MPIVNVLLYLSDDAQEFLTQSAKDLQYISPYARLNTRGLGTYIEALSRATYYDSRPPSVRALDIQLLEANRLPMWSLEIPRRTRSYRVQADALTRLRAIAIQHGITNARRSDSIELPNSPISALLEAIGTQWLTPYYVPPCPHPPRGRRYSRPKEHGAWL